MVLLHSRISQIRIEVNVTRNLRSRNESNRIINNNINRFLYSALSQPEGRIKALLTLLPLVTGPYISFLKPSQLPGEYTAGAASYRAPS